MRVLFWLPMALLLYAYVGYPLVLWILTTWRPRDVVKRDVRPTVSVIVAARNEADKIRRKIEHTLELDYPRDRLEILVASDASDDGTDEIVQEYAGHGVRLVRAPRREGKENAQGLALAAATGDIVVMTDAATILEPGALRALVSNFADLSVGAVSSEDVVLDAAGNPTGEGLYVKYEMWVRRLESRFHSIVGLSGSCFAIRRALCTHWPATLASDFMGALHAARAGTRAVADPAARGRFVTVTSPTAERRRKVRTFLRGITVLMANLDLLDPLRHGRFAFQLASHKLLRFLAPLLLLAALVGSGLGQNDPSLRTFFWLQVGFYLVAVVSGTVPALQRIGPVRVAHFFTMVQWAMLIAWVRFALGQQQTTWEPSRREAIPQGERRPTVCHVFSGDLWAGAEVVIFNLLSALQQERGLRVIAIALNEGTLTARLREAGVTTHVIPEARHSLLRLVGTAARLLRDEGVTIVHSHRYKENVLAWLLARRLGSTELITTVHGVSEATTLGRVERWVAHGRRRLDYLVLRRAFRTVVAVSEDMKRVLVGRYGFPERQVSVIRNGGQFPPRWAGARQSGAVVEVGTVGRMVPVKGLDLFLEVAAAVVRQVPHVRFSVLGDGPLREALERQAERLQLGDRVRFLAPRPDVFGYYRTLDLYLNTSLHEGLPLSVVEAMACGLPVISAAVGGIPEIVTHGQHGFLVEGRAPEPFVEHCVRLIRDERLRTAIGEHAAAMARAELSAPAMAAAYRRLYDAGSPRDGRPTAQALRGRPSLSRTP